MTTDNPPPPPGPGYELNLAVARKKGDKFPLDHSRYLAILKSYENVKCNDGRGIYMRCDGCDLHGYGNEVDWTGECPTPVCEPYSTDITVAWGLFQYIMDNFIYSKRQKFFKLLQEQARLYDDSLPAWPDVLSVLRNRLPHALCLAFLAIPDEVLTNGN